MKKKREKRKKKGTRGERRKEKEYRPKENRKFKIKCMQKEKKVRQKECVTSK